MRFKKWFKMLAERIVLAGKIASWMMLEFFAAAFTLGLVMAMMPWMLIIWLLSALLLYLIPLLFFHSHIGFPLWVVGYFFLTALMAYIHAKRRLLKTYWYRPRF